MTFILISIVAFLLAVFCLGRKLEKAQIERCEKFKKEQFEQGVPEELVNLELLSCRFMV